MGAWQVVNEEMGCDILHGRVVDEEMRAWHIAWEGDK